MEDMGVTGAPWPTKIVVKIWVGSMPIIRKYDMVRPMGSSLVCFDVADKQPSPLDVTNHGKIWLTKVAQWQGSGWEILESHQGYIDQETLEWGKKKEITPARVVQKIGS